jgi:predicted metal-dependent hydrolase
MRKFIEMKTMWVMTILMAFGMVRGQNNIQPALRTMSTPPPVTPEDQAAFLKNKEAWIAAHPETCASLSGRRATSPSGGEAQMSEKQKLGHYQAKMDEHTLHRKASVAYPWRTAEDKEAWIASHPREYREMSQAHLDTRMRITRTELSKLPANKQRAIMNDPNHFVIDSRSEK